MRGCTASLVLGQAPRCSDERWGEGKETDALCTQTLYAALRVAPSLPSEPRSRTAAPCPRAQGTQPCTLHAATSHVSPLRLTDAIPRVPSQCSGRFWYVPKTHASPRAAAAAAAPREATRSSVPQVGAAARLAAYPPLPAQLPANAFPQFSSYGQIPPQILWICHPASP